MSGKKDLPIYIYISALFFLMGIYYGVFLIFLVSGIQLLLDKDVPELFKIIFFSIIVIVSMVFIGKETFGVRRN